MPRSKLVQVLENKIEIPEEYHVYMPKDHLLVIQKLFTYQFAVIDLIELRVLQSTIQRKSIVPTIITVLSWTPKVEKELQKNGNGKVNKSRKPRKTKNGNDAKQPPRITILNFIKPKKVIVVQQQQQPQTQQQNQQQ
jgi:hypothetical protein